VTGLTAAPSLWVTEQEESIMLHSLGRVDHPLDLPFLKRVRDRALMHLQQYNAQVGGERRSYVAELGSESQGSQGIG
jgi:hypothetical protein